MLVDTFVFESTHDDSKSYSHNHISLEHNQIKILLKVSNVCLLYHIHCYESF